MVDLRKAAGMEEQLIDVKPIKDTTALIPILVNKGLFINDVNAAFIQCPNCTLHGDIMESMHNHPVGFHEDKSEDESRNGGSGLFSIKMQCDTCRFIFYISIGHHKGLSTLHFRVPVKTREINREIKREKFLRDIRP